MDRESEMTRVPLLNSSNYPQWKFRMRILLEEHELKECIELKAEEEVDESVEDVINSSVSKKAKSKGRAKKDRRCKSLLVSRISDDLLEYIQDKETPRDIWLALSNIFERKSIANRLHMQKKLLMMKYTSGELKDHFLAFERAVREYKSTGVNLEEIDIVCYLLITLANNKKFATVVTAIETMPEEKLTMDFVKCRLLDEEIKYNSGECGTSRESKMDNAAFTGVGAKKQNKDNKKKNFKWKCFGCHREGHKISECPEKEKRKMFKGSANVVKNNMCFVAQNEGSDNTEFRVSRWIVDSGSSEHMSNDRSLFNRLVPMKRPMLISVAKEGETITAKEHGDVSLLIMSKNQELTSITLKDVLYIPEARVNLLSVRKIEMAGWQVLFAKGSVTIGSETEIAARGELLGKLYELKLYREIASSDGLYSCGRVPKELVLWHRRYGHLSAKNLKVLVSKSMVDGMEINIKNPQSEIICESCHAGKQMRKPFKPCEGRKSNRVIELIHSDVCGPFNKVGINGERYFVTFIDDWSRFTMVFPINSKDEVLDKFVDYEAFVHAKFGLNISRLRCDNGGEYVGREFKTFCKNKGIRIEWTVPYSPEQNGVSERMNRTLVEKVRSMIDNCGIGNEFWPPAIQTAAYLANRSPASALGNQKTPYEIWENRKPDVRNLRVFGSVVYVHIPKEQRKKLDAKSWKGVFIGYDTCGYRIWHQNNKKMVVARDVDFVESENINESKTFSKPDDVSDVFRMHGSRDIFDDESDVEAEIVPVQRKGDGASSGERAGEQSVEQSVGTAGDDSFSSCFGDDDAEVRKVEESPKERSVRNRKPPTWQNDYEMHYAGYAFHAINYVDQLPTSLAEAKQSPDWKKWQAAVRDEMDALQRNGTWTLVKLPEGRVPISCRWIFKVKHGESRGEDRYKARLVARGFSQRFGFDYSETYSPVARLDTVRIVLAVANEQRMLVNQMDVKTAFLNGKLNEEIYMTPPEGFDNNENYVCRLNRSLYGLKQASRAWNDRFHSFVEKLGFQRSYSDKCLYTMGKGMHKVLLVLYVDDLLVIGHDMRTVISVKKCFSREFEMSDLGEVKTFLGMKIERNREERCLRISQRNFLENLLIRFNMQDCNVVATPMECNLRLKKGKEDESTDKPYRQLIGCLMYVTLTSRPDLCAAVNYLSQFQSCANEIHWKHAKRILRYIKGTLDIGLVFEVKEVTQIIEAFADADWANDTIDRHSLTGYIFRVYGSTVSWLTKKQSTIALSSTEAELVALSVAVCHGKWLIRLLKDLDIEQKQPVVYHEDNQSTIRVVEDEKDNGRLKHVDVRHRFVHEEIQRGHIKVSYIPTGEQIADIMTKGLAVNSFQKHRANLGLLRSEH